MLLSTHYNRGRSSLYFAIGSAHFHPSKKLVDLDISQPVYGQCHISETPHEDRFARNAKDSEDAARVLLRIRGTIRDGSGKIFDGLVQTGREKGVNMVNYLFDILIGRTAKESGELPERYKLVRDKPIYT
jgi:hypothetical protein